MRLKQLYFFRHGQTDWNKNSLVQGHEDIPLNETGIAQAHTLGSSLAGKGIEVIVSSDLLRASQTAAIVADYTQCSVIYGPDLKEVHLGHIQGKTSQELVAHPLWPLWISQDAAYDTITWPGGESKHQVKTRGLKALELLLSSDTPYITAAISSHSLVMRLILKSLTGDELLDVRMHNGGCIQLDFDDLQGIWVVNRENAA